MGERGTGRSVGAPFYAPRRKTSAEIISEARAAISTEMNNVAGTGVGALRPLRTRRPFTPREPQRTLFTERTRKKDQRPPSAFDLKYLTLSETAEDALVASGSHFGCLDEDSIIEETLIELNNTKKKPAVKPQKDRLGDGWGGFPKLPHLSGRSKPLHRRNNTGQSVDAFKELDLSQSISVSQPLVPPKGCSNFIDKKSNNDLVKPVSPDSSTKKKQFLAGRSLSCDTAVDLADVSVRQLVQLPSTITNDYENIEDVSRKPKLKQTYFLSMTVLELAEALSQRNRDFEQILQLMQYLQNHIIKTSPTKSLRELVLRSLYTHIDSDDERILVAIARAMLTMRVTGAHLAAACKLIFKIARNDKNDHFFRNSNLLELLIEGSGRIEPIAESECCVYAAGALRFLALEPRLRALAHRAGALHLTALHLKIFNNAKAERPRQMTEQATHALYQVTGALRNLAARDGEKETEGELDREEDTEGRGERDAEEWDREGRTFVSSGALSELIAALTLHTDRDVLTNVARCLSVLSSRAACCAYLCASGGGARALLGALAACAPRAALAVRLAYTLGNMAAADEQARIHIYNEEGGVDVLLTILESYTQRNESECRDVDSDPDLHLVGSDLGGSDGSNEDVLIKTVRVVANLCLAERAGRGLAAQHAARAARALLCCLTLAEKTPDDKLKTLTEKERIIWLERREELAMAVLATINNITFYLEPSEAYPEDNTLELLCKATCKWIRNKSSAACEAVRALGNLSRSRRAAQLIVLEGALDVLPAFQQHEDPSVRCAAAGVLVNICAAGGVGGAGGASTGGVRGLGGAGEAAARALVAAARTRDAITAALLARALWNAQAHGPLEASHARNAATALDMFLDDDSVFTACEASKCGDRRASDPQISKNHVKFQVENNNYYSESGKHFMVEEPKLAVKAYSVEGDLHLEQEYDEDGERYSGEDLGFEEGEVEECECEPCVRLAAWEELVGVAIPLLEKLRPHRADASVGTD